MTPPDCAFTYHDFILGSLYAIIAVGTVLSSRRFLTTRNFRVGEDYLHSFTPNYICLRFFIVALALQCTTRATGFYMSPFYLDCQRKLVGAGPSWLDALVNIPAVFEISTFSTLIWAFASSYHLVLHTSACDRCRMRTVTVTLVIINISSYALLTTAFVFFGEGDPNKGIIQFYQVAVGAVCVTCGVLGLMFVVYGMLILHLHCQLFYSSRYSSLSGDKQALVEARRPLFRMTLMAIICAVCFLARAMLLLASMSNHFDVQARVETSACYFVGCEILPAILMMHLFLSKRESSPTAEENQAFSDPADSDNVNSPFSPLSPEIGQWVKQYYPGNSRKMSNNSHDTIFNPAQHRNKQQPSHQNVQYFDDNMDRHRQHVDHDFAGLNNESKSLG